MSFDVPLPADYGGVIDVFYKVKALHAAGLKIHLHCFHYGRAEANELRNYCEEVFYYKRNMNRSLLIHPLPFIVVSRQHDGLLAQLKKDEYPILFEGKHCAYYLDHPELGDRKRYLRTHNVEADYYAGLAASTSNPLRRWYLRAESKKLKRYRDTLSHATHLFCISSKDMDVFKEANENCNTVLPFHANETAIYPGAMGEYCLYHGNLAVAENEEAALFLIQDVFADLDVELRIFGSGATKKLRQAVARYSNVSLVSGNEAMLNELVQGAQVHVLPTFQSTGMKLKLLYSLFNGRHVLVNRAMVQGTGAESLVVEVDSHSEWQESIKDLMTKAYEESEFKTRAQVLESLFSNRIQAEAMIDVIFAS